MQPADESATATRVRAVYLGQTQPIGIGQVCDTDTQTQSEPVREIRRVGAPALWLSAGRQLMYCIANTAQSGVQDAYRFRAGLD